LVTNRRRFLQLSAATMVAAPLTACAGTDKQAAIGVPRSQFDDKSTAEEVTQGIDLTGKLAVVTGCTSGIGFETLRVLALRGAHVVGTSRSLERAQAACAKVRGVTSPLQLELSDPESIIACANAVRSINLPLDILVCNAGYLGGGGERQLVDGIEKHFAINHLGHFILVNRLLGRLYMANQGRIVVVGSRTGYTKAPQEGIEFDNLDGSRDYEDRRAYGHSKLANALFSLHLARLLRGTRITSNALHPGVINTEIDRHMNRFMQKMFSVATTLGYGKTAEQGAATSCYVATSPLLGSTSGQFFEDCNAVQLVGDNHMHNEAMAERLWQVSEDLTREHLVTHTGPDWNDYERAARERAERLRNRD
jgi:NAD(P)-dependent dehydrogenase (short-subunit alcohol dehydrogenase family)